VLGGLRRHRTGKLPIDDAGYKSCLRMEGDIATTQIRVCQNETAILWFDIRKEERPKVELDLLLDQGVRRIPISLLHIPPCFLEEIGVEGDTALESSRSIMDLLPVIEKVSNSKLFIHYHTKLPS